MTAKAALAVLALESAAEQRTVVRPTLKRLPDFGRHETGTAPSTSSVAVTLKVTRAVFAPFFGFAVSRTISVVWP